MVKEFIQLYHGNIKVEKYRNGTIIEVRKGNVPYIYIEIYDKFSVELKLIRSKSIKNLSTFPNSIPIIQRKLFDLTDYSLCINCDNNGLVKITYGHSYRDMVTPYPDTPYPYTRIKIRDEDLFPQICKLITNNDKFCEIINKIAFELYVHIINTDIVLIGVDGIFVEEVVEKILTNRPTKELKHIYFTNKNIDLPFGDIEIVNTIFDDVVAVVIE